MAEEGELTAYRSGVSSRAPTRKRFHRMVRRKHPMDTAAPELHDKDFTNQPRLRDDRKVLYSMTASAERKCAPPINLSYAAVPALGLVLVFRFFACLAANSAETFFCSFAVSTRWRVAVVISMSVSPFS